MGGERRHFALDRVCHTSFKKFFFIKECSLHSLTTAIHGRVCDSLQETPLKIGILTD